MSDYDPCPSCGKIALKGNVRAWGHCGCVRQTEMKARKQAEKEAREKNGRKLKTITKRECPRQGLQLAKLLPNPQNQAQNLKNPLAPHHHALFQLKKELEIGLC